MYLKLISALFLSLFLVGCASVPMQDEKATQQAKEIADPPEGKAGVYIYRDSYLGAALKKDIWINGKCIGESAPMSFFYEEVEGDKKHTISTESEFSPNDILLYAKAGENYFVRQFIKMGIFVGGAGLRVMDEEEGEQAIQDLSLAIKGNCSE